MVAMATNIEDTLEDDLKELLHLKFGHSCFKSDLQQDAVIAILKSVYTMQYWSASEFPHPSEVRHLP